MSALLRLLRNRNGTRNKAVAGLRGWNNHPGEVSVRFGETEWNISGLGEKRLIYNQGLKQRRERPILLPCLAKIRAGIV